MKTKLCVGIIFIFLFSTAFTGVESDSEKKWIKIPVAKHIVKGSGVTKKMMEDWLKEANKVWAHDMIEFVQSKPPGEVDNVGDNRENDKINIYGSDYQTDCPVGNPARMWKGSLNVEIGKSAPVASLAHELGHAMGANPDDTDSEHGNPEGSYPDGPGYKGYDTDGDGDHDADDRKNIMYPGTGRTGTVVDNTQSNRARSRALVWLVRQGKLKLGQAAEMMDSPNDSICYACDLWYGHGGFYGRDLILEHHYRYPIDTDTCPLTWHLDMNPNPETGNTQWEYLISINPQTSKSSFYVWDENKGEYVKNKKVSKKIGVEELHECYGAPVDPKLIGFKLSIPIKYLDIEDDLIAFWALTGDTNFMHDIIPDKKAFEITKAPFSMIEGYVTDKATGEPIPKVKIKGTNKANKQTFLVKTDKDGFYNTGPVLTPGKYVIIFKKAGNNKGKVKVKLKKEEVKKVDFQMIKK